MNRARCLAPVGLAVVAALGTWSPVTAAPADSIIARIPFGGQVPGPILDGAFGFGSLWVSVGNDEIARIDPTTNSVVARATVGAGFRHEIATGEGAVWVTNPDDNSVSRIDPGSTAVTGTFSSGGLDPVGVAVTPGAVWVSNHHASDGDTGSVVRLNPVTGAIVATIPLGAPTFGGGPGGMTASADGVWVGVPNLGAMALVGRATNSVDAVVPVAQPCGIPATGINYVLMPGAGCGAPFLGRVDPITQTVMKLNPGGIVRFVATAGGSAWASVTSASCPPNCPPSKSALVRVDVASGDVIDRIGLDGIGFVAIGAGSVWVGVGEAGQVLRVQP